MSTDRQTERKTDRKTFYRVSFGVIKAIQPSSTYALHAIYCVECNGSGPELSRVKEP